MTFDVWFSAPMLKEFCEDHLFPARPEHWLARIHKKKLFSRTRCHRKSLAPATPNVYRYQHCDVADCCVFVLLVAAHHFLKHCRWSCVWRGCSRGWTGCGLPKVFEFEAWTGDLVWWPRKWVGLVGLHSVYGSMIRTWLEVEIEILDLLHHLVRFGWELLKMIRKFFIIIRRIRRIMG